METVLTTLHAGGKFENKAYKVSGGLHGVGVSVVCALSKYMKAEVCRDGYKWMQEYKIGKPVASVKRLEKCKETGTTITFLADEEIFKEIKFDEKKILNHLRRQAYLTGSIRVTFYDKRDGKNNIYNFYFQGGLKSYLKLSLWKEKMYCREKFLYFRTKMILWLKLLSNIPKERECYEESYANNINTPEGGTHLSGLRNFKLTRVLNDYARKKWIFKEKDQKFFRR